MSFRGDTFLRTSVLTKATQRNIPGDDILHSHSSEDLKRYACDFALSECAVSDRGPSALS
jgi:hypothetical protein